MSLFIPITKVDIAQRLVYGTISEEVPDKTGEILDYASSKPAFEEWSRQFQEASGGKSMGNVRAMHGAIAAGKFTDLHFDDENKRIDGAAKIIDDDEWQKVIEGVYTGFSIGGGYARRWPDKNNPQLMRYTPVLSEVSLVDNPAVPTATFQIIKQDGSVEMRKFNTHAEADVTQSDDGESRTQQLLCDLKWLGEHAQAIGAAGLLAHITAIQGYLEEADKGDLVNIEPAAKTVNTQIETLQKRIVQLEAQPLPAKGVLKAFGKQDDRIFTEESSYKGPVDRTRELMRAALANPILA